MEMNSKKNLILNLYYLSLALVIVTLPFSIRINNLAIIISVLGWLGLISSKDNLSVMIRAFKANKVAIFLAIFALANLVSVLIHFYSYDDLSIPIRTIEKRIHILMFPLMLSGLVLLEVQKIRGLLKLFITTMIFSTLLSLIIGLVITLKTGSFTYINTTVGVIENNIMYHRLGSYLGIHAVFFSSYVLFAYCIVLIKFLWELNIQGTRRKLIYLLVIIYFWVVIFLLFSIAMTATLFISTILILGYFASRLENKVRWQIRLSFLSLCIIGIIGGIVIFGKLDIKNSLLEYNFEERTGTEENNWNAVNIRLAKWEIASKVIRDHWLLGVGPGNMGKTLDSYYEKHNFHFALRRHFNPHNQFLHTFLVLGIGGLIILLWILYSAIKISAVNNDLVLGSLLLIFLIFSMTASTLSVSKGIVFFSFFLSFLTYLKKGTMQVLVRTENS